MQKPVSIPDFILKLSKSLQKPLPGHHAHSEMLPTSRTLLLPSDEAVQSAVLLIVFFEENGWQCIIIQRPVYDGIHSGQAALPGGKHEVTDIDMQATALRETREELGIDSETLRVIGQLTSLYIPPSNFLVHVYVAWHVGKPEMHANPSEVDCIHFLPLNELKKPEIVKSEDFNTAYGIISAPCFDYGNLRIWGATAMIINEFKWIITEIDDA